MILTLPLTTYCYTTMLLTSWMAPGINPRCRVHWLSTLCKEDHSFCGLQPSSCWVLQGCCEPSKDQKESNLPLFCCSGKLCSELLRASWCPPDQSNYLFTEYNSMRTCMKNTQTSGIPEQLLGRSPKRRRDSGTSKRENGALCSFCRRCTMPVNHCGNS